MDYSNLIEGARCLHNRTNNVSEIFMYKTASASDYNRVCADLKSEGFIEREQNSFGTAHYFTAFLRETDAVFVNFFANINMLTVSTEENTNYFNFSDVSGEKCTAPKLTQRTLKDFGMSYVLHLSDGRFLILDSGREFESDADSLYEFLCANSSGKPQIAAWIFSHPHDDHCYGFMTFFDKYGNDVVIEKILYYFPCNDDTAHYPHLAVPRAGVPNSAPSCYMPDFEEKARKSGADIYCPRTGQTYVIGDAKIEILGCMDDSIYNTNAVNGIALVIRVEFGGQVMLFATDAPFSSTQFPQKYREYLKADILQIPHHGFGMGTDMGEVNGFSYINPETCFLPFASCAEYMVQRAFREPIRYLVETLEVGEIIAGEATRTLEIPYHPTAYAKLDYRAKYDIGKSAEGFNVWMFTGLNTGCADDLEFAVTNMIPTTPTIKVYLYFDERAKHLSYTLKYKKALCISKFDIFKCDENTDDFEVNLENVRAKGIPEKSDFSIRFVSDFPVVISNKKHKDTFHA